MSLHFVLQVNGRGIGACVIRCLDEDRGTPDPDATYSYSVDIDALGPPALRHTTTVQHRYGDGAWRLVQLAAEQAAALSGDGA